MKATRNAFQFIFSLAADDIKRLPSGTCQKKKFIYIFIYTRMHAHTYIFIYVYIAMNGRQKPAHLNKLTRI